MERAMVEEHAPPEAENRNKSLESQETESAANFQKFIYELFEKNGVLNDLRAYLRGQIVNVLKCAQTGEPPACQKHFTQRLELKFQALNMLIAEYLLRLEFSYTLSVFVSEIPLANMVFDFAKILMQNGNENTITLRFKEKDMWSILNYLGIKCDSEHASSIMQMYTVEEKSPLLLCILRCMPMYQKELIHNEKLNSSVESLSSNTKSSDIEDKPKCCSKKTSLQKCTYHVFCKACESRYNRLREKYKKKKKSIAKNAYAHPQNVETLLKNISILERNLVDEMFQQLKTVYEGEVELMKEEEERRVKHSLANHAQQLQKCRTEMEETFKAREEELEKNVQQKKKFLWGLARALREQHDQMSRAMQAIRHETARLSAKEDSLKSQLIEAEQILRKRGEDMRKQISNELVILEGHLESMKKERDSITRERSELEDLKLVCDSTSKIIKIHNMEMSTSEDLQTHYELLKNELAILRKYLESTKLEAKCVIERGTMTDFSIAGSKMSMLLNNEQELERSYSGREEDRNVRTPNQVVNDFKKPKNVNFSQANLEEVYRECSRTRERSHSTASSEAGDVAAASGHDLRDRDLLQRLRDENERLRLFSRQQEDHIADLARHGARLQAELAAARHAPFALPPSLPAPALPMSRPRTAPPAPTPAPAHLYNGRSVEPPPNANTFGWRKGAGEELSLFSNAQPRILVPGDTVPFIGMLRDRNVVDNRKHLINQLRALRRRLSPNGTSGITKVRGGSSGKKGRDRPNSAGPSIGAPQSNDQDDADLIQQPQLSLYQSCSRDDTLPQCLRTPVHPVMVKIDHNRDKSPKSLLREAKNKLRNKDTRHPHTPPKTSREKSPNSVLREAKLRLRKLEIEAEAVEKSYKDFRRKQSQLRVQRSDGKTYYSEDDVVTKDVGNFGVQQNITEKDEKIRVEITHFRSKDNADTKDDFDKCLRKYEVALDVGERFKINDVTSKTNPIPEVYAELSKVDQPNKTMDYLQTPLTEFRKLYRATKSSKSFKIVDNTSKKNVLQAPNNTQPDTVHSTEKKDEEEREAIMNAVIKEKNKKIGELEILKNNITKIYNLQEPPTDSPSNTSPEKETDKHDISTPPIVPVNQDGDNNLRIEVETTSEVGSIKKSDQQNMLLVVQSTLGVQKEPAPTDSEIEDEGEKINPKMTIIISPKRSGPIIGDEIETVLYNRLRSPDKKRSVSPEQAARLTSNDVLDAIFHADMKDVASVDMQAEGEAFRDNRDDSISEVDPHYDYPDDFSADVDNYYNRSDDDPHISHPKTSDDEKFWDS